MSKGKGCLKMSLTLVLIIILLGVGYVRGVVKLVKCDFKEPYKAEVIYGVGTATGLGAVIGWFNIPDGNN